MVGVRVRSEALLKGLRNRPAQRGHPQPGRHVRQQLMRNGQFREIDAFRKPGRVVQHERLEGPVVRVIQLKQYFK